MQISLLFFFLSFTSLYSRFGSKSLSHLIRTKVPPSEKKVVNEREKKWNTYWQKIKTISGKARREFWALEDVWLWFEIRKFTYKLNPSLSWFLSLSWGPWLRASEQSGLWLRHNLGTVSLLLTIIFLHICFCRFSLPGDYCNIWF